MATWLQINEPGGGLTDRSRYLHFGDPAGGLGPGEQTHWQQMLKQRGTADIALSIPTGDAYLPTIGSPIYLYDWDGATSYLVFSGTIDTIETAWFDALGNRIVGLSCVSFEQCFSVIRVYPGKLYQSMTCGAIVTDLLTLAAGWPGTTGRIDDGVLLDSLLLEDAPTIANVFDKLAILSNFVWWVDPETHEINFTAPGATAGPWTVEAADVLWQQADVKVERHDFRDRQIIKVDYDQIGRSAECFAGTGQTVFNLRNPVHDVTGAWITKNTQNTATGTFSGQPTAGDTVTVGYPTSGSSYNWTANSPYFGNYQIIDPAGHLQTCVSAGTSGSSQPAWNDNGGTTSDGTVGWRDDGLVGNGGLYAVATYVFVTALDNRLYGQVLIGASAAATCQNLVDAINSASSTRGTKYSLPTWENRLVDADQPSGTTFTVRDKGPGKASIASLSASSSAFSWSAGQTSGGVTTFGTTQISVGLATANNGGLGYTPGSPTVLLFHGPLNVGTSLCVEYHRIDGDLIAVEDSALVASVAAIEHGTGKYQAMTSDTSATPLRALAEAQAALEAFGTEPETFAFMTYRPGIKTGMLLDVGLQFPYGPSTETSSVTGLAVYSVAGLGKVLNIATGSPPANWETPGFNDSGWAASVAGVTGVPPAIGGADWISDFSGNDPADTKVLFRIPFTLTSTKNVTLQIVADNYITACYVNGHALTVPSGNFALSTVAIPAADLVVGANVLAVEVLNDNTGPTPLSLAFSILQPSGQWIVQEITADLIPMPDYIPGVGGHFRYTIRVINASQIGSYLDFWESFGGGSGEITSIGGSSSTGIQNTAIGGVQVKTANYSTVDADVGNLISFNSASPTTLTLPATPPSSTWLIAVENANAGVVTISPSGRNIDGSAASLTLAQNQGAWIWTDGTNYFTERGIGGSGSGSIGGVLLKTASYLITTGDTGKLVTFSSGSAVTATLPASAPTSPWIVMIENRGAGALTVSPNGLQLDSSASSLVLGQGQGLVIYSDGSNYYSMRGLAAGAQTAGTAWMGPASGSAAPPTFRAITSSDLPPAPSLLTLTKYVQNFSAVTTVDITHNFGSTAVNVQVYDSGTAILVDPETLTVIDANTVRATFGAAFTGYAVVLGTASYSGNTVYATSWTSQTSVTVTHNLGSTSVSFQVFDGSGLAVLPESSTVTSSNVLTLTFGAAFTGSVVVMIAPNAVAAIQGYTTSWVAQTSVTVTHSLNTSQVIVQVFNGSGLQVLPESVTITSANVVTLTFGSVFTGSVVVIG